MGISIIQKKQLQKYSAFHFGSMDGLVVPSLSMGQKNTPNVILTKTR